MNNFFSTILTLTDRILFFFYHCHYYIPSVKYPVRLWSEFPLGGTLEH